MKIDFREKYSKSATGVMFSILSKGKSISDLREINIFNDTLARFSQEDALTDQDLEDGIYTARCYTGTAITPVMLFGRGMPCIVSEEEHKVDLIKIVPIFRMVVYVLDPNKVARESVVYADAARRDSDKFYGCRDAGFDLAVERRSFLVIVLLVGWDMDFADFNSRQRKIFSRIGYVCDKRK